MICQVFVVIVYSFVSERTGRPKVRPHQAFFRYRVDEHGLTDIIYLKFAMTDQVETGEV